MPFSDRLLKTSSNQRDGNKCAVSFLGNTSFPKKDFHSHHTCILTKLFFAVQALFSGEKKSKSTNLT